MSYCGELKKFMDDTRFGFIDCGDVSGDVFVDFSQLNNGGSEDLVVGTQLTFDLEEDKRYGQMKFVPRAVNVRIKRPHTESTQEVEPRSPESERSWFTAQSGHASSSSLWMAPPAKRPPLQSTAASSEGSEKEAATRKREVCIPLLPADLGAGLASQILRERDFPEAQFVEGAWRVL